MIRAARPEDAPAIAAILQVEIASGVAHFGTRAPSARELAREIEEAAPHVFLVAVEEGAVEQGTVVGFARSMPWKAREAYAWTAEVGVYVADGRRGAGVGRALVAALVERLRDVGFRTLLAGIAVPNAASVALCEGLGFVHAGTLPGVGYKAGAWRDVGYWSLSLGEGPPVPFDLPA